MYKTTTGIAGITEEDAIDLALRIEELETIIDEIGDPDETEEFECELEDLEEARKRILKEYPEYESFFD